LQITFDTATVTPREAVALIALLDTVSPGALLAAYDAAWEDDTEEKVTAPSQVGMSGRTAPVDDVTAAFGPAAPLTPPPPCEPVQAEGGPVDADGLPWDDRIHAKTADGGGSLTADGRWRKKRGVADALVQVVTAELKGDIPPPPVDVPAPPVTVATAPDPAPSISSAVPPIQLFQRLMGKITPAQNAGKLTVVDIAGMCEAVGVKMLGDLIQRPDLLEIVEAQVDAKLAAG